MKRLMALIALAALLSALQAAGTAFIAGNGTVGEPVHVLCENEREIFVSSPAMTFQAPLDSDSQSSFIPDTPGPHTIQCGNRTLTIEVKRKWVVQAPVSQDSSVPLALMLVIIPGLFTVAAAFFAWKFIMGGNSFTKTVSGNTARLELHAGSRMEDVLISDPVRIGHAGKENEYRITRLEPGGRWSVEYETEKAELALPAHLEAMQGGSKIAMLSALFIDGKPNSNDKEPIGEMKKKTLPKADGGAK